MTDGQSEAARYIDTSHPALRQTAAERIAQHRERYEQLKKNARLAMPPWTVDDCRFMLWLLDGDRVEQRRRCDVCNCLGELIPNNEIARCEIALWGYTRERVDCWNCNGTGYESNETPTN